MEIGQYRIIEKIGQGGMGVIYKAEHTTLEQIVAIKALPSTLGSNSDIRERFIREAKIQAKLSHPNVVNILNFLEHEGNNYIVMEYVDGETLEAIIRTTGLIPPERCIAIVRQVLDGIGYAHSRGVIHRDIKPSNIMITRQGNVKITDFGIAKIAGDLKHTQTGVKVGTLWYMSPEQVQGQQAGVTSDIYALGITLFEMVTGKVPFTGDSEYHIMHNIVQNPPPDPREFYPYIPLSLEKTILKAIAKSPADRFQNVGEFAESLGQEDPGALTPGEPCQAAPANAPAPDRPAAGPGGKKLFWVLGGALALALVVVAAVLFYSLSGQKAQAKRGEPVPPPPARMAAPQGNIRGPTPDQAVGQVPAGNAAAQSVRDEQRETSDRKHADGGKMKGASPRVRTSSKTYAGKKSAEQSRMDSEESEEQGAHTRTSAQKTFREAENLLRDAKKIVPGGAFTEGFTPHQ